MGQMTEAEKRKYKYVVYDVEKVVTCCECKRKHSSYVDYYTNSYDDYVRVKNSGYCYESETCSECREKSEQKAKRKRLTWIIIITAIVVGYVFFGLILPKIMNSSDKNVELAYNTIVGDWREYKEQNITVSSGKQEVVEILRGENEYYCYVYENGKVVGEIQKLENANYYFHLKGERYGDFADKKWFIQVGVIVDVTNGEYWKISHADYSEMYNQLMSFLPEAMVAQTTYTDAIMKDDGGSYRNLAYFMEGDGVKMLCAGSDVMQIGEELTFKVGLYDGAAVGNAPREMFDEPYLPALKENK